MRRLNMFLVIGILLTFLAHSIMGAMVLIGAKADALKPLARVCVALIGAHALISGILTYRTLHARRLSGAGYFKDNLMFWTRRLTGLTILIPLIMHLFIFHASNAEAYRLTAFTTGRMISQILLVATLGVHILTNVRPVMISLGVRTGRGVRADILFVLSVVLLLLAIAFFIYYLRWMRV